MVEYLCDWEGLYSTEPMDCRVIASEICDSILPEMSEESAFYC